MTVGQMKRFLENYDDEKEIRFVTVYGLDALEAWEWWGVEAPSISLKEVPKEEAS